MDCIFCKIVNNEIPAKKVYEDDHVVAFHDINPIAPVHILVIPKKHIPSIMDVKEEDFPYIRAIHSAIQNVAKVAGVTEDGFRVVNNCGKHGQQSVFHIHYHVIGGRQLNWTM
jgi:histidine triad (HIT) family protein